MVLVVYTVNNFLVKTFSNMSPYKRYPPERLNFQRNHLIVSKILFSDGYKSEYVFSIQCMTKNKEIKDEISDLV